MLIILFGLSGAGKNFTASILEKKFNYFWWDADEALTEEMQQSIKNKISFTQEMRDTFTQIVIEKISFLIKKHHNLVVTQGLYKEQNRQQIVDAFPQSHFIWVKSQDELINQRLKARNNEVGVDFAEKLKQNFEKPSSSTIQLANDSDEEAIETQFKIILNTLSHDEITPRARL